MDIFNKKQVNKLQDEITHLDSQISSLNEAQELLKQKNNELLIEIQSLEESHNKLKSEIISLHTSNPRLNFLKFPLIRELLDHKKNTYDIVFVSERRNDISINDSEHYLRSIQRLNLIDDYCFLDIEVILEKKSKKTTTRALPFTEFQNNMNDAISKYGVPIFYNYIFSAKTSLSTFEIWKTLLSIRSQINVFNEVKIHEIKAEENKIIMKTFIDLEDYGLF
jgi:cell division septum initiation protein DivIVA